MTGRSNGLRASAYCVLVEVEESLGDPLLDALAERHIAAYVVPARGPGGTTRLILHVDAQRRIPAGIVLAGLTPTPAGERAADQERAPEPESGSAGDAPAIDAAFDEIVAGFYRTPENRPWPEVEDLPAAPAAPAAPPRAEPREPYAGVDRRRPAADRSPAPEPKPVGRVEPDATDDHYSPPDLPRLTPSPPAVRWAFLALGFGLALLLLPTFLSFGHTTSLDVVGVSCILLGTAILLSGLRDRAPDDPDDGAVV